MSWGVVETLAMKSQGTVMGDWMVAKVVFFYQTASLLALEIKASTYVDGAKGIGEMQFAATIVVIVQDAKRAYKPTTIIVYDTCTCRSTHMHITTFAEYLIQLAFYG